MATYMISAGKERGEEVMRMRQAGFVLAVMLSIPVASVAGPTSLRPVATSSTNDEVTTDTDASRLFKQKLASAEALFAAENIPGAFRAFDAVVRDPAFAKLPMEDQWRILSHAGDAAFRGDKPVQGRDIYRRLTESGSDEPDDWYRLMLLEERLGSLDRAREALRHVVNAWPDRIPNFDQWVIPVLVYQSDLNSEARYELMQALFDANWQDSSDTDSVWYQLAIAQIQRGQADAAARTIRRIDQPGSLVRLRADKRFDALLDRNDDAFDPVLAARRRMERLAGISEATPDKLEPIEQLGHTMLALGMFDQVVSLADEAIDRIVHAPAGKPPFTDMDNQVWVMNLRSNALGALGRQDEALAELKRARSLDEEGQPNVSQAINLADFYCRLQRPKDSLRELSRLVGMSGFGLMSKASVEHCAAYQLGNRKIATRALSYMRRHESDDPLSLLDGLLREGRMDEAAGLVKKLLADGYRRGEMLEWMQDFRTVPSLPGDAVVDKNGKALVGRSDVAAALERVGRIDHYDFYD